MWVQLAKNTLNPSANLAQASGIASAILPGENIGQHCGHFGSGAHLSCIPACPFLRWWSLAEPNPYPCTRPRSFFFSVKGQIVNVFYFDTGSVTTTELKSWSRTTAKSNAWRNDWAEFQKNFLCKTKQWKPGMVAQNYNSSILWRLKQQDQKLEVNLGYTIRPCHK